LLLYSASPIVSRAECGASENWQGITDGLTEHIETTGR
jgi:hypothetical protein